MRTVLAQGQPIETSCLMRREPQDRHRPQGRQASPGPHQSAGTTRAGSPQIPLEPRPGCLNRHDARASQEVGAGPPSLRITSSILKVQTLMPSGPTIKDDIKSAQVDVAGDRSPDTTNRRTGYEQESYEGLFVQDKQIAFITPCTMEQTRERPKFLHDTTSRATRFCAISVGCKQRGLSHAAQSRRVGWPAEGGIR